MGVTRKYIRGRIYVPSEKCFQICDLHEASRHARVDSSVKMERTDAGCVGGRFQYAYLHENSERVIFSEEEEERERGEGRGKRGRQREWIWYKWDGGTLQILSSVNSHDPHSFRSLILSRVARWIRGKTYASMSSCHRCTGVHICYTSHFARYQRQHRFIQAVMNYSGLTKRFPLLLFQREQSNGIHTTSINTVFHPGLNFHLK